MSRVKVLIVDDSVVIRKILTEILGEDTEIEVIGTAANGKLALQRLEQGIPDLITLDVEMPELNGIETLRAIRKKHPRLPVIMFSTLTERGASTTVEALSLGASDYCTKPANVGSVSVAKDRIRQELVGKIKALCGRSGRSGGAPALPAAAQLSVPTQVALSKRTVPASRIDVVAIGVSTGGPNALAEVIPSIPGNLPVPILITQHMPPLFTKMLADRLDSKSGGLRAHEAQEGMKILPGNIYIAPGDYHLDVERRGTDVVARLHQSAPEHSCRPAVDVMFRSIAKVYGPNVLGVILTGMGQDGLKGCELFHQKGAQVIAQDQATSVVWGMPGFVAQAGIADAVLPLKEIGPAIGARVLAHPRVNIQKSQELRA